MAKKSKSSKPVRLKHTQLEQLAPFKDPEEPWSVAIEALLEEISKGTVWTLPGATFKTKKDAMKLALELGAQANLEFDDIEQPIKVRRL